MFDNQFNRAGKCPTAACRCKHEKDVFPFEVSAMDTRPEHQKPLNNGNGHVGQPGAIKTKEVKVFLPALAVIVVLAIVLLVVFMYR